MNKCKSISDLKFSFSLMGFGNSSKFLPIKRSVWLIWKKNLIEYICIDGYQKS